MNRTARRIRTISAATLALTAAGLTLGSITATTATAVPLPLPIPFPVPVLPTLPPPVFTIPPLTIPPFTIPPIITIPPSTFVMPVSLTGAAGPVERGANYAYSMTISMGSGITGPVNLIHSIPSALTGAVWSCSTSGGASCGGGAAGSGNISRVLTMPASSSVTFLVNGTIAADATNFQLAMSAVRGGSPTNRTLDVAVNVPAPATTTPPAVTTTTVAPAAPVVPVVPPTPVVPPAPVPAPTPAPAPAPAPAPTPAQQPIVIVLQQPTPPVAKKAVVKKAKKKVVKKKIVRKPVRRVVTTKAAR